ncbi:MAG: ATP-dependent Clp protease adaptor ClpS [Helicobacteraceae bacterium]|jgi:ATP-dependent Clp protease adaptor protein ClpS|nr:ATP-dependent Clp protease adaptor ClpS [Helicobacteraceae bacterium]
MALNEDQEYLAENDITLEPPRKYQVVLHNDHYSTWEFVVEVLKRVFHKSEEEAVRITGFVHNNGFGICGEYSYEIAEMKVMRVQSLARSSGYPLKCTMREA